MRLIAAVSVVLFATGAHAVMPPEVYQRARDEALYHVQVKISKVEVPATTPGSCRVVGEVARVFRDLPGNLAAGSPFTFSVSCTRAGDRIPIGGVLWTDSSLLAEADYIETFLNGSPPDLDVALYQSQVISGPSDAPQLSRD